MKRLFTLLLITTVVLSWQQQKPRKKDGKYGYIDSTGKFVIEPRFNWAGEFSEGLARVGIGGKGGVIDRTGKVVVWLSGE